jgi:hypothetical protein
MSYQSEQSKKQYADNPKFGQDSHASCGAQQEPDKKEIAAQRRRKRRQDPEIYAKDCALKRKCQHKKRLETVYGITVQEYDAMLARQGGVCKLCKRKPERTLCVDHCHVTGKVRGLLCGHCNSMLGFAKDDPSILEEGAKFLRGFQSDLRREASRVASTGIEPSCLDEHDGISRADAVPLSPVWSGPRN